MPQRKIGRREFLKLAIAAAGAAGLSHFRILNIGGVDVAYARLCEAGDPNDPDTCDATSVDWCIPQGMGGGDPDLCSPDPGPQPSDMCPDDSPGGDGDYCPPTGADPDVCAPGTPEPDTCFAPANADVCYNDPSPGDDDVCNPGLPEPDVCRPSVPEEDTCEGPPDMDICLSVEEDYCGQGPLALDTCIPLTDPDVCDPGLAEPDECIPGADPDVCLDQGGVDLDVCAPPQDPDVCSPTWDPDVCEPPATPADDPNPVTIGSVGVESAPSILPSLGGVVAALGAAALWLRHRLRPEKPEEEESA